MNKERLLREFNKLISFDSPSFYEDEIAFYLYDKLKELGLEVSMDNALEQITGRKTKAGNIYGFLKGNTEEDPILFSSHMDTVKPAQNKKAVIQDRIVKSAGDAVLGADDATGIAEIIEMLTSIKEEKLSHPDIEVIFFVAEEEFGKGSAIFDYSKVKSKIAYVLDLSGRVGDAAISAPSIISFELTVTGKASHAGFEPESGISSIMASAKAISRIKTGRINDETTLNIGTISGGVGKNIVPEKTFVTGEVRSMNHDFALEQINNIKRIFNEEAVKLNASVDFSYIENIFAYKIDKKECVVQKYLSAVAKAGYEPPKLINTFGGSDNNTFNKKGIHGIVIANAMNDVHTTKEYFELEEFYKATNICIALATS
ncbi:M20/M25/M40 family metallo-hydrolase [Treponema zioleckii]|uniref:M20/M25/M40 family metallo-hydrolase n=1 Tax=Treponema zioleckii TaxID=331680 RepID=UPI00168ADBAE|nr:M20/M25/M40 family metallo-hydrolase [Treponema zioleckii]